MPMSNITFEDYRKAIKAKYEKEIEGDYSNNLSSPTAANLRNLCIKRFTLNTNKEDLLTFESFFDFPFDRDKKNLFGEDELNKLEAVKRFFLGKTEKPSEDTIQLAAILVDLKPRPFNKFRKQIDEEDLELINELRVSDNSGKDVSSDILSDKVEIESPNDSKKDFVLEESEPLDNQKTESTPMPISTFSTKDKESILKKIRYLAITFVLIGLGLIIYFALSQKECMQWSNDHFEMVDCDLNTEGFVMSGKVEPYDESKFGLKKIKVCDTTTCFINGDAIVWYAKTSSDKADFFNTHGRHPENDKPLRPVTNYIINKYGEKSVPKK